MGSEYTSIRLTEDAYETLKQRKRDDESFSETVKRLAAERSLLDLTGVFTDNDIDAIRSAREDSYQTYTDDRERRWTE